MKVITITVVLVSTLVLAYSAYNEKSENKLEYIEETTSKALPRPNPPQTLNSEPVDASIDLASKETDPEPHLSNDPLFFTRERIEQSSLTTKIHNVVGNVFPQDQGQHDFEETLLATFESECSSLRMYVVQLEDRSAGSNHGYAIVHEFAAGSEESQDYFGIRDNKPTPQTGYRYDISNLSINSQNSPMSKSQAIKKFMEYSGQHPDRVQTVLICANGSALQGEPFYKASINGQDFFIHLFDEIVVAERPVLEREETTGLLVDDNNPKLNRAHFSTDPSELIKIITNEDEHIASEAFRRLSSIKKEGEIDLSSSQIATYAHDLVAKFPHSDLILSATCSIDIGAPDHCLPR